MKLKLATILFLLGMFLLVATLSLFDILYPAIGSLNFYIEAKMAMQKLAIIRISATFMIFMALGLYLWSLADIDKK